MDYTIDTVWNPAASAEGNRLTSLALDEFVGLTAVPRPGFHMGPVIAYCQAWAEKHGFTHGRDDYGNFWMDVPATPGFENHPKVILQAHMDMVCVAAAGKTIDFKTEGVTPVLKGTRLTADGTSLGADNGIGMAAAMAVAVGAAEHGPLRCLFTADEDVGLVGAAHMDPSLLDCDLLVNIDLEEENQLCYSCAGNLRATMKKTADVDAVTAAETLLNVSVTNLLGGHSGMDIHKNRLCGAKALVGLLAGVEGVRLVSVKAGTALNAISQNAGAVIALPAARLDAFVAHVESVQEAWKTTYPNETPELAVDILSGQADALSVEDSRTVIELVAALPQGVIAMSQKVEGLVQTSSNVGVFTVENGAVEVGTSSRSCVTADVEALETRFADMAAQAGLVFTALGKYPGWDGAPDSPLTRLFESAYAHFGVKAELVAIHAGLEPSWFSAKRPGMQMVCLGPTLTGAHTTDETLYLDTLAPTMDVILHALKRIDTLA
jgi:dipeptidase D